MFRPETVPWLPSDLMEPQPPPPDSCLGARSCALRAGGRGGGCLPELGGARVSAGISVVGACVRGVGVTLLETPHFFSTEQKNEMELR